MEKKKYYFSTDADRIVKPLSKLTLLMLVMSLFNPSRGQAARPYVSYSPLRVCNPVTPEAGGMPGIPVNSIKAGQIPAIPRT